VQCAKYTALLVALSFVKAPTIPAHVQSFKMSELAWNALHEKCTWCNRTDKFRTDLQWGQILGLKLHCKHSGTAIGHQTTLCRIVNPNRIDRWPNLIVISDLKQSANRKMKKNQPLRTKEEPSPATCMVVTSYHNPTDFISSWH
jgi:hypothetical protein